MSKKLFVIALSCGLIGAAVLGRARAQDKHGLEGSIEHVLLVSIDGMHVVDYLNCVKGLSITNDETYCPNLAELGKTAWKPAPPNRRIPFPASPRL